MFPWRCRREPARPTGDKAPRPSQPAWRSVPTCAQPGLGAQCSSAPVPPSFGGATCQRAPRLTAGRLRLQPAPGSYLGDPPVSSTLGVPGLTAEALAPGTSECGLIRKWGPCRCSSCRWGHSGAEWAPVRCDPCPYKKRRGTDRYRAGGHLTTDAEMGGHGHVLGCTRSWEARQDAPVASEGARACQCPDLGPPAPSAVD